MQQQEIPTQCKQKSVIMYSGGGDGVSQAADKAK